MCRVVTRSRLPRREAAGRRGRNHAPTAQALSGAIFSVMAPVSALPPDLSGQRVYCDVLGGRPSPAALSKHEPWSASCLPRKPAGPWLHDTCSPEPQPRKTLQYMPARLRQQPRKLNASECWLILRSPSSQVNPSSRPPPDCLPIGVLLVV